MTIYEGDGAMKSKLKRPGGRTEKNRQAVAAAVLDLIGEGKLDFEIQEVVARSGVHRTTIFRRWPDRGALIAEALADHVSSLTVEFTGDWKEDLRRTAYAMRDFLNDPVELAMNRMMAITDNQDFHEQMMLNWLPILETFRQPIQNAKQRGELHPDVDADTIISLLLSPILNSIIFSRTALDDKQIDQRLEQLIRGCTA